VCDRLAEAAKIVDGIVLDLLSKERVRSRRPACCSWCSSRAAPEGHERQRASGTWDLRPPAAAVEGDQGRYVGSREACLSTPPFILCAFCRRRAGLLIKANPVLPGRERRGWYPLGLVPSWAAGGGARPRRLERSTSRSRCFMSWAARIARRGCSVPGGRTGWPAPLAGRCSSDGRVLLEV